MESFGLDPARPRAARGLLLAAGILAGLASWAAGEAAQGAFAPPEELLHSANLSMGGRIAHEQLSARIKNATLASGLLGGLLGLALGAAGGASRRSARSAAKAGAIGLVVGAAAGAQGAWAVTPVAEARRVLASESLGFAMLMHAATWSAAGAAAGLAFGLGAGRGGIARAALGGLAGAAIGAAAYDLIGAVAFPMAETWGSIATSSGARLLAGLCVAVPTSAGVATALEASLGRRAAAPPQAVAPA